MLWNPDGTKIFKLKAPVQINSQPTFAAAANAVAVIPTSQIRIASGVIWRTCFAISLAPFSELLVSKSYAIKRVSLPLNSRVTLRLIVFKTIWRGGRAAECGRLESV